METMTNLHISQHALEQWLYQMVNSKIEVFAPVHDGEKTDFRLLAFGDKVADDYVQTTQSAKRFAFPKAEKLFSYRKEGKDVTLQERDLNDFRKLCFGRCVLVMRLVLLHLPVFLTGIIKTIYIMRGGIK